MKQIKVYCDRYGKIRVDNPNILLEGEHNSIDVVVSMAGLGLTSYFKRLDILVGKDKTIGILPLGLVSGDVLTVTLTSEHLKSGYLRLQPVAFREAEGETLEQIKWEVIELKTKYSINANVATTSIQVFITDYIGDLLTVKSITTNTLGAGEQATVSITTASDGLTFVFGIPQGVQGETGSTVVSAEFVDDDIVFTKDDASTVSLIGAKETLIDELSLLSLKNIREPNPNTNIFDLANAEFVLISGYNTFRTLTKTADGITLVCTSTDVGASLRYDTSLTIPTTGRYLISCNANATYFRDARMNVYINGTLFDYVSGIGDLEIFVNLTAGDILKLGFYDHINTPVASTTIYNFINVRLCDSLNNTFNSKLKGKKIVCFGDSITGMFPSPSDYPSMVYDLTGANVINVGFSGCEMADHTNTAYRPFSMNKLADAINTNTWTSQESQLVWLPLFTDKLNILKTMDWLTVDIITIFYGTNDWASNKFIYDEAGSDRTNSAGKALEYSLDLLMTKYPHIKFLVICPIWRNVSSTLDSDINANTNGDFLYEFADKFQDIAKVFHIPSLNLYHDGAFNKYTKMRYTQDGTHPNADGRRLIAHKVAGKLLSDI